MFDWIEGNRTFDIVWGIVTAALCYATAIPLLWWVLPQTKRSFFGHAIDPQYRLQGAFGVFGMAMATTNFGCRVIDHGPLEAVHPTFFVITVLYVAALAPRAIWMTTATSRNTARADERFQRP